MLVVGNLETDTHIREALQISKEQWMHSGCHARTTGYQCGKEIRSSPHTIYKNTLGRLRT